MLNGNVLTSPLVAVPVVESVETYVRVKSPVVADPPTTTLTNLSVPVAVGGAYAFVIEQLAVSPGARTRLLVVSVPAVQDQAPGV